MAKPNLIVTQEDVRKMRLTNGIYNQRKINSIDNIGCVMKIIVKERFSSVQEWICYYFESGKNRRNNFDFGRTKEEFEIIIQKYLHILQVAYPKENFTYEDAKKQLYQRVFYDTWNGLNKEISVIDELKKLYPNYVFNKCNGHTDMLYAVDVEINTKDNQLISGIQVKPVSYLYKKQQYLKDAHELNKSKNQKYIEENNVPVLYLYYNESYNILNTPDFQKLKKMVS